MKNRRYVILILFSLLLSACGQQGPLFMPVENESIENSTMENSSIEDSKQETELQ